MSVEEALEAYLGEVAVTMGGSFWDQQAVRSELRAHLAASALEYERGGQPATQAMRQAMRDLGLPADVGMALRHSRGRAVLKRPTGGIGNVGLGERRQRHLPRRLVMLALVALFMTSIAIVLAYTWP